MFHLDDEVRRWRQGLESRGWFSRRELDELEDHLRAHARELELGPGSAAARVLRVAAREEIGEASALFREFSKSETPAWRPVLLAGWGLFALSFGLPGFGAVAFQPSSPDFGLSASGWEFIRLAVTDGWMLALLPNLAMGMTLPMLGRARRRMEGWVGRVLGAVGVSALGFGVLTLLRPPAVSLDGDFVMYGHLGPAYWLWAASFLLVATAQWLRARSWTAAACAADDVADPVQRTADEARRSP